MPVASDADVDREINAMLAMFGAQMGEIQDTVSKITELVHLRQGPEGPEGPEGPARPLRQHRPVSPRELRPAALRALDMRPRGS